MAMRLLHSLARCRCASQPRWACITFEVPQQRAFVRGLSSSPSLYSGHNRWSKIKHDKARVDTKVNKQRSRFSSDIEVASREGGPDSALNPRLASVLAAAKKAGFPKASIEAAVARGQGRSPSGAALEHMVIEILHSPTGAAAIIECLTDNKAKTLQEVREKLKTNEASQAPIGYMFERRGRLRFGGMSKDGQQVLEEDAVMEAALSAGALDIEFVAAEDGPDSEPQGERIVYTEPSQMVAVADAMAAELGTKSEQIELVWYPKADMTVEPGSDASWDQLSRLVDQLETDWTVAGVYLNAK